MTHHRHLVQRGLAVEDDHVVIAHEALDDVAWAEVQVCRVADVTEILTLKETRVGGERKEEDRG